MRLCVTLIKTYRLVELFKRLGVFAVSAVYAGKLKKRRTAVRIIPRRAVQNIVSLAVFAEVLKRHALKIKCLGIGRMLVAVAKPLYCLIAIFYALCKFAVFKRNSAHRGITAYISLVTAKPLKIVILGFIVMLFILLQMETVNIQLLYGFILRRTADGLSYLNRLLLSALVWLISHQFFSVFIR